MTPEELFQQMEHEKKVFDTIKASFQAIEIEVYQGLNLSAHLKTVNGAITEIQAKVDHFGIPGRNISGLEMLREDLYYLVEEILKRL